VSIDAVSGVSAVPAPASDASRVAAEPVAAPFSSVLQKHLDGPKRDISTIRAQIASIRAGDPFWSAPPSSESASVVGRSGAGFSDISGWLEDQLAAQATGKEGDPYGWRALSRNIAEEIIGPGYGPLFERQIDQESGFAPDVVYGTRVSSAGAEGIAQLMPQYYADVDRLDPVAGLTAGAQTMRHYLSVWDGDVRKALASYNCGLGRVQSLVNAHGATWESGLPEETRNYLNAILGPAHPTFNGFISDVGAVFGGRGPGGVIVAPVEGMRRASSGAVEFFAAAGATIRAPADGVVLEASGGRVVLDHGNGWRSVLEGLATLPAVGTSVTRSQPLGTLGAAGQLRLAINVDGVPTDPERYLLQVA